MPTNNSTGMANAVADNLLENTRILSQWKRLVGSPGEQAAKEWIVSQLEMQGIPVSRDNFTCTDFVINVVFRILSPLLSIALFFAFIFAELPLLPDWGSFITTIFVLVFAIMSPRIKEWSQGKQGRMVRRKIFATENIIGSLDAPTPAATIVLMAHYDSKSQTYPANLRVALFLASWYWGILVCVRMLIEQAARLLSISVTGTIWDVTWVEILFPCILGALLLFNGVGNTSPGALDNASAVSILLHLARYFKDHPLRHVNLRFVATTAEEIGLYGAYAFVRAHSGEFDKKSTYFLIYDSPTMKGPLWVMTSYGFPKKILCKEVGDLLFQVGQKNGIPLHDVCVHFGSATEHIPVKQAGYNVGVIAGPIGRVHTPQDTMEFITQEGLERAALLGRGFIQEIDERFSPSNARQA